MPVGLGGCKPHPGSLEAITQRELIAVLNTSLGGITGESPATEPRRWFDHSRIISGKKRAGFFLFFLREMISSRDNFDGETMC